MKALYNQSIILVRKTLGQKVNKIKVQPSRLRRDLKEYQNQTNERKEINKVFPEIHPEEDSISLVAISLVDPEVWQETTAVDQNTATILRRSNLTYGIEYLDCYSEAHYNTYTHSMQSGRWHDRMRLTNISGPSNKAKYFFVEKESRTIDLVNCREYIMLDLAKNGLLMLKYQAIINIERMWNGDLWGDLITCPIMIDEIYKYLKKYYL